MESKACLLGSQEIIYKAEVQNVPVPPQPKPSRRQKTNEENPPKGYEVDVFRQENLLGDEEEEPQC